MARRAPTSYQSIEEFEREELHPYNKAGWSLDDLYSEARFNAPEEPLEEPAELDFDFG
jgi:hypothetical protein